MPPHHSGSRLFLSVITLCAAVLLTLVIAAVPVSAHPPSDMAIAYDNQTADLAVTITHVVSGTKGHYIKEVTVTLNGQLVNDSVYTSQPDDIFTYTYPVRLNPGDAVVVTATCSITGTASRTFIMPGPAATVPTTEKSSVPAAAVLVAIGAVCALRKRG